jgi:hypothetical protein
MCHPTTSCMRFFFSEPLTIQACTSEGELRNVARSDVSLYDEPVRVVLGGMLASLLLLTVHFSTRDKILEHTIGPSNQFFNVSSVSSCVSSF